MLEPNPAWVTVSTVVFRVYSYPNPDHSPHLYHNPNTHPNPNPCGGPPPSDEAQAIFRTYRYGQTRPVVIYRLVAEGTPEEKIYDMAGPP